MGELFIQKALTDPLHFTVWTVILVFSICMHEFAHAWTAYKLGDDTAARLGHLTRNPMKQMGPISLLMFAVAGIAWGSVPVTPHKIRGYSRGEALVAAAGPLTNLWLGFTFMLLFMLTASGEGMTTAEGASPMQTLLATGMRLNLFLCLFNLIPVPPLDGWTVLKGFSRPLRLLNPNTVAQAANIALLLVLFSPVGAWIWRLTFRLILWFLPKDTQWVFWSSVGGF